MHPSRTYVALIAHSSTGDVASTNGTGVLDSDVRRPTFGGAGVELSPVVFEAALWSRVASIQPLRTDPRQKTC